MSEDLKPCPFCKADGEAKPNIGYWNAMCPNNDCPVKPDAHGETRELAIKAWNTRAIQPDTSKTIKKLVDALKAYQELAPFLRSKGIHCSLPEEFKL